MWRKLQAYQSGEELFGLPTTDYPELAQIRKELNLLQKLYKLYNDVIDRVSSYYDIPWGEVNIEEINNELMEFQNRCRKLPKGLKVNAFPKICKFVYKIPMNSSFLSVHPAQGRGIHLESVLSLFVSPWRVCI